MARGPYEPNSEQENASWHCIAPAIRSTTWEIFRWSTSKWNLDGVDGSAKFRAETTLPAKDGWRQELLARDYPLLLVHSSLFQQLECLFFDDFSKFSKLPQLYAFLIFAVNLQFWIQKKLYLNVIVYNFTDSLRYHWCSYVYDVWYNIYVFVK